VCVTFDKRESHFGQYMAVFYPFFGLSSSSGWVLVKVNRDRQWNIAQAR